MLLIAVVVVCGALVAGFALGLGEPTDALQASVSAEIDPDEERITLVHDGGDQLDVDELSVQIEINDQPLAEQPPVPFFSARGFRPGPTGPFNAATTQQWRAGERASLRLASTNAPSVEPGDRVVIELTTDDRLITTITTTA